jgi:hypothetical protein
VTVVPGPGVSHVPNGLSADTTVEGGNATGGGVADATADSVAAGDGDDGVGCVGESDGDGDGGGAVTAAVADGAAVGGAVEVGDVSPSKGEPDAAGVPVATGSAETGLGDRAPAAGDGSGPRRAPTTAIATAAATTNATSGASTATSRRRSIVTSAPVQ